MLPVCAGMMTPLMPASLKLYKEVGYKYMIMPDHVPKIAGRDPQGVAFAFCYGYIAALMQVLGENPSG